MTLIVAKASWRFALEVSDRLLTSGNKPFDPRSNKNVLFVAKDAVVALGYTGRAYIQQTPTDQWIAETLIGEPFARGGRLPAIGIGTFPGKMYIGPALTNLAERLTAAFNASKVPSDRNMPFEILATGWQWSRRHRPRPIMLEIKKPRGQLDITIERVQRHFGSKFQWAITLEGNAYRQEVHDMRAALRANPTADDAELALVKTIRAIAAKSPYAGADCMSILMPPPGVGWARVRYFPVTPAALEIRAREDGTLKFRGPAAYSPWVVSPGLVHAPSVLMGKAILQIGGFEVQLEGPNPIRPGIQGAMGAVERPPQPR